MLEGTANYLGMRWRQDENGVALGMGEYIGNLEEMDMKPVNGDLSLLDEGQVHMFKSMLAKLLWPVSHALPELAYAVSSLAQIKKGSICMDHLRHMHVVVATLRGMDCAGQAELVLPRVKEE